MGQNETGERIYSSCSEYAQYQSSSLAEIPRTYPSYSWIPRSLPATLDIVRRQFCPSPRLSSTLVALFHFLHFLANVPPRPISTGIRRLTT